MTDNEVIKFDQLKNRQSFLPESRRRVGEVGLALVIAEELEKANIHFNVEGGILPWSEVGQPTLAVGDHSKGLECLLLLGVCGAVGREDVSITAKPYALTGQIANALSDDEKDLLGLIPGNMAKGRRDGDMGTKIHRRLFKSYFPEKEKIQAYNQNSMDRAAELIEEEGRLVSVFPTGGVYDAATTPWRKGVGELAARLSPESFDETAVVPFAFENVSPMRILRAILLSKVGYNPRRQEIMAVFGSQEKLGNIFDSTQTPSSIEITQTLQRRYQAEFAPSVS